LYGDVSVKQFFFVVKKNCGLVHKKFVENGNMIISERRNFEDVVGKKIK